MTIDPRKGRINRESLTDLKREMSGQPVQARTGDISMHPVVRNMKMAFYGRNPKVKNFFCSTKIGGKRVTILSIWDKTLCIVKNEEGKNVGVIKASPNSIERVGAVPTELLKQVKEMTNAESVNPYNYSNRNLINDIVDLFRNYAFSERQAKVSIRLDEMASYLGISEEEARKLMQRKM